MKHFKFLLIILLFFSFCKKTELEERVADCTEIDAINYNSKANVNCNNCYYGTYVKLKFSQEIINKFNKDIDSIYVLVTFENNSQKAFTKLISTPKDTFEVNIIFVNFGSSKKANVDFAIYDYYEKFAGTQYFLLQNKKQFEITF